MASSCRRSARRSRRVKFTGFVSSDWESPRNCNQPFTSIEDAVEAFRAILRAREQRDGNCSYDRNMARWRSLTKTSERLSQVFHRRLALTKIAFAERLQKAQLAPVETEAVILAGLYQIGLIDCPVATIEALLSILRCSAGDGMRLVCSVRAGGRLARTELLIAEEDEDGEDIKENTLRLDPSVLDEFIQGRANENPIEATSEAELHRWMRKLIGAIGRRAGGMRDLSNHESYFQRAKRAGQALDRLLAKLRTFLNLHGDWGVSRLLAQTEADTDEQHIILLALAGKALSHLPQDHCLFTGEHLAWAVTPNVDEMPCQFDYLKSDGPLVKADLIRPCAGQGYTITDHPDDLRETEFELTERALDLLGIERHDAPAGRKAAGVREAVVRLDQLVLSDHLRECIDMALVQARHYERLMSDWGLGRHIAYGRAVTLLFAGPPGVGKTAAAEALAAELGRPIIVADYSQIQNCFVGETEKRIAATFRNAARYNAVLFWDEADAMFFNRDAALHTWEVRDVNVLLAQLERFEGVCILATNRKVSLDPALERRISLKVAFTRPDAAIRRQIWNKLIPAELPLAKDVDLDELSRADLSGGQIKNAVLNAARRALCRDPQGNVNMGDFRDAVRAETEHKFSNGETPRLGFHVRFDG